MQAPGGGFALPGLQMNQAREAYATGPGLNVKD
nr:MAG TPA: hypothetical protein [Caudoviricetes sp.]